MLYKHPLWAHAPKVEPNRIQKLVQEYRAGSARAYEDLYTAHIRLALIIVGNYLDILKSKRWVDDLVSVSMVGIGEGLKKVLNGCPINGIHKDIHYHISAYLKEENSQRDFGITLVDPNLFDFIEGRPESNESLLSILPENELESQILTLLLEGNSFPTIANILDCHVTTVRTIVDVLRKRYTEVLDAKV